MHSSVLCFSVQQNGLRWVSICLCWLIIFGGNIGESGISVLLLAVARSPVAVVPVKCFASLANKDAFWSDTEEILSHGSQIRTILFLLLSLSFLFVVLEWCCVCLKGDVSGLDGSCIPWWFPAVVVMPLSSSYHLSPDVSPALRAGPVEAWLGETALTVWL